MTAPLPQRVFSDRGSGPGVSNRAFPFDIAIRASNLSERVQVLGKLSALGSPAPSTGSLSGLDLWRIERLAPRLAAQLQGDPSTAARFSPGEDEVASALSSYAHWASTADELPPGEQGILADLHEAWLPTYRSALAGFEPSEPDAVNAKWRDPQAYYGRFARACEPFLLHVQRELEGVRRRTNDRMGTSLFRPTVVEGLLDHLLDRFDLALAWAIEADMSVYCSLRRIDKASATEEECLQYFEETFGSGDSCHRFYLKFPVLGRWLAHLTSLICENGRVICERLGRDLGEISPSLCGDTVSEIVSVTLGRSDYHASGQSVAIVEVVLAHGERAQLVYKPRSLSLEAGMQELLGHLKQTGVLPFGTHKVIDKGRYGYEELIPSGKNRVESITEAESVYEELGGYLGIFHVLGGGDLHYENVLVAGHHAYVCDCETVLGVRLPGRDQALGTVLDSVYKTGLLEWPRRAAADEDSPMRLSGYAGGESYELPVPVPRVNDHRMSFELSVKHHSGVRVDLDASNRVYLGDEILSPVDFAPSIINGFGRMHRWFEESKSGAAERIADLFSDGPVRYVNWATQIYLQLLVGARHPKCLMDPLEVDLVFNRLLQHPRSWDAERHLAEREVASLWQLDVPMFTARAGGDELLHDHRHPVPIGLAATPIDDATERIASLTPANHRHQVQYIAASLASSEVHSPEFVEAALEYARKVGLKLCSLLQDPAQGSPWKSYEVGSSAYRDVDILSDLYNGTAGVALFLAYLDAITPHEQFRSAAQHALKHAITNGVRERVGAFQGAGGLVYVLTHLWHLWHEGSLLERAVELSQGLAAQVVHDREFDVLSGVAGVIPVMMGLANATSGDGLECAHACAQHLLRHAERGEKGLSWPLARPDEGVANLTGFAHGSSGIGWALISLGCLADDPDYIAAGREAFEYETLFFDDEKEDWYDLRKSVIAMARGRRTFSNSWCNGSAGIGLSRITTWALLGKQDDGLLRESYAALGATVRNFHRLGNDSLCHGKSGNAELFLRFALLKDEAAFQLEANIQGQAQWQSIEQEQSLVVGGEDVRVFPGLMLGLAGFGLHFLRLAYPDRIPSPLLLDSYPGSRREESCDVR
jgi:type 2 lantibiotic biosynthesis protein LanM